MTVARELKAVTSRVSLMALAVTFELTSKYVKEMQDEIADWDEGLRIGIGVLPSGPNMTIVKEGGRIKYLGADLKEPMVSILFKNLDSAILIFTGQLAAHTAVAENRVCVRGNNYLAMQATRGMAIVQTYLFPGIMLKNTFKRPPKLSAAQLAIKAKIMGLLTPKLLGAAFK